MTGHTAENHHRHPPTGIAQLERRCREKRDDGEAVSLVGAGELAVALVVLRVGGGGRGVPHVPRRQQVQGVQRAAVALGPQTRLGAVRLHRLHCHQHHVHALLRPHRRLQGGKLRGRRRQVGP